MIGGVYADLKTINPRNGLSIWLHACLIAKPDVLGKLLAAGCDVAQIHVQQSDRANDERSVSGWSCLFFVVLHASRPETSDELQSLQILLSAGADPFQRDAEGYSIFDYVNEESHYIFAHYQRELWYRALQRAQINFDHLMEIDRCPVPPVYNGSYTPIHYRALRHLDSWTEWDVESQVNQLLKTFPWTELEAEWLRLNA